MDEVMQKTKKEIESIIRSGKQADIHYPLNSNAQKFLTFSAEELYSSNCDKTFKFLIFQISGDSQKLHTYHLTYYGEGNEENVSIPLELLDNLLIYLNQLEINNLKIDIHSSAIFLDKEQSKDDRRRYLFDVAFRGNKIELNQVKILLKIYYYSAFLLNADVQKLVALWLSQSTSEEVELLNLVFIQEETYREIAKKLNCTKSGVQSKINRLCTKLLKELNTRTRV